MQDTWLEPNVKVSYEESDEDKEWIWYMNWNVCEMRSQPPPPSPFSSLQYWLADDPSSQTNGDPPLPNPWVGLGAYCIVV